MSVFTAGLFAQDSSVSLSSHTACSLKAGTFTSLSKYLLLKKVINYMWDHVVLSRTFN